MAVFDFQLKYRPGTANRNADVLSRQNRDLSTQLVTALVSGITVPLELRVPEVLPEHLAQQAVIATIDAAPIRLSADLRALQAKDSVIGAFLVYWKRARPPNRQERTQEAEMVLELARQWRRIREQDGILYREIQQLPSAGPQTTATTTQSAAQGGINKLA